MDDERQDDIAGVAATEGAERQTVLVRVSGRDRPGITVGLLRVLAAGGAEVYDMEQLVVRERLTLDLLVNVPPGADLLKDLLFFGWSNGIDVDFEVVESVSQRAGKQRLAVTAVGRRLTPEALAAVTGAIADSGGNIDRIVRMSRYPVVSYEFEVVDADVDAMRAALVEVAGRDDVDIAVQAAGLGRRAKRLVVLDVDSTLIQNEVIELLAEEAGALDKVAEITERAMAGELDFTASLTERVALLAGLDEAAIERARERIQLTPGARTFVRTLRRLGFKVGIVSGGFTQLTDGLKDELGLDHAEANTLEVVDGRLTGRLLGPVVDRARKADALREFAAREGISLSQTVAVGDGANDLDMLAAAGLGIAFNAKPVVREAADTALSVPFLDAILFVLGFRGDEVEQADLDDGIEIEHRLPVEGTPPV